MAAGLPIELAEVSDLTIDLAGRSLAARLYRPVATSDSGLPLTLFFHGGGWVLGTLDTHDATCRALAKESGSAILSVAYRLAPEHPFPVPLEDCYDTLVWARRQAGELGLDPHRLAVAGDSAGGNLAAATAILARDRGGPELQHQLLLYPVTDCDFTTPSYLEKGGEGHFLTTEMMRWFWQQYLAEQTPSHCPLACVLRVEDLSDLPPATIITAEYDPLCDEGRAYAERLAAAGTPAQHLMAPGMIHGFISMFEAVPDAWPWIERAGEALRAALAEPLPPDGQSRG